MADSTPPPEISSEPGPEPPSDQVAAPPRRWGRGLIAASAAVVVVVLLGGAAYGVYQYLDGDGPRPEEVLPASTVAVISVDLDPKAGQKIEAIKTLRKFPALRESLGIESQDDLRRYLVDEGLSGVCPGLDYDEDVEPWIGKRAAFAAVDLGDEFPAPALVLQVEDAEKAEAGFKSLVECGRDEGLPEDLGFAVGEDYVIASDSTEHAEAILADGEEKPLADDKSYTRWTDEAGGSGIVNLYVAPKAAEYLGELAEQFLFGFGEGFTEALDPRLQEQLEGERLDTEDAAEAVKEGLEGFEGAAGALRFADGGMEFTVAAQSGGTDELEGDSLGDAVTALPADTALALGLSVPEGFLTTVFDEVSRQGGPEVESFLAEAEQRTGLDLPEDLSTLLGDVITLSIGGGAPASEDLNDPEKVPVGLTLRGDPDAALEVIETAEQNLGLRLADIPVVAEKDGDALVLSPSSAYAEELTKSGGLGGTELFERAVPDAGIAQFLLFVAVDDRWREAIVDLAAEGLSPDEARQLDENLEPFGALGLSSTIEDGVGRFQFRVATR